MPRVSVRSGSGPAGPKCKPKAARTYTIYKFSAMDRREGDCPWGLFGMLPGRKGPEGCRAGPGPILPRGSTSPKATHKMSHFQRPFPICFAPKEVLHVWKKYFLARKYFLRPASTSMKSQNAADSRTCRYPTRNSKPKPAGSTTSTS